jgi:hypothetical protein
MLTISDPYLSVTLDSPSTGLAIARNGWSQAVAEVGANETRYDVEETIILSYTADGTVSINDAIKNLQILGGRARAMEAEDHPDNLNPSAWVQMQAKTPSETDTRKAKVKDVTIEKLAAGHYGRGLPRLKIKVLREGSWRVPLASPTIFSSTTMRSTPGLGAGCFAQYPATGDDPYDIPGDAPGTLIFNIGKVTNAEGSQITIARKTAETEAELDDFTPFHWVSGASSYETVSTIPNMVTILQAAIGAAITPDSLPAAVTFVARAQAAEEATGWIVESVPYAGRYSVYAIYASHGDSNARMRLSHGYSSTRVYGDWKTDPEEMFTSCWLLRNLGQIQVPSGSPPIRGSAAEQSQYDIRIHTDSSNGNTFIAGMVLVPINNQAISFALDDSDYTTVVDGEILRCYKKYESFDDIDGLVIPYGSFPTLQSGKFNRFYILPDDGFTDYGRLIKPSVNLRFELQLIPRFDTLS